MRQLVRILRLALVALCGLLVAVALIPAGGAASGPHSPALRDATVTSTAPDTSTDDTVCDGDPACDPNCDDDPTCDPGADPCFDDGSCDSTTPDDPSCLNDDSCDSTTPDDPSCLNDDSCDSTPPDDPGTTDPTTAAAPSGQTISRVVRRGYLDAGWITLTSAGWIHATLTQPGTARTSRHRTSHARRHHATAGSTAIGRGHASTKAAGQVHLVIHLTGHGRHVLRAATGPLHLTLRTTIKLHGEHASTSTAPLVLGH